MGSEKPVYWVQPSIKKMFPSSEWEAWNIRRQRKQFIKEKIWGNNEVSPSKQDNVTNSRVKDPKRWRYIEIKVPLYRNF